MMALAGCTSAQGGTAAPAGGSPRPSTYQAPANGVAGVTLPPRPADVPLTGADPCALLTATQREQVGVAPGVKGLPAQLVNNSPSCDYRLTGGLPGPEFNVVVDTTEGIQLFLNPRLADDIRQVSVSDFPALDITLKAPDLLQGCTTAVSVASGQMIVVNLGQPSTGTTTAQSCARTEQVAGAVLATARTSK
jgi:hypothetical protein